MTPKEPIPSHIIDIVDTTIESLHIAATALITYAANHHAKDHRCAEVPQLIPETTADPDHVLHINQVRKLCLNLHPVLTGQQ